VAGVVDEGVVVPPCHDLAPSFEAFIAAIVDRRAGGDPAPCPAAPNDTGLLELSLPVLYNAAISPSLRDETAQRMLFEKLVAHSEAGLARGHGDRREIGRGALLGLTALALLAMHQDRLAEAIEKIGRRSQLAESLLAENSDLPTQMTPKKDLFSLACPIFAAGGVERRKQALSSLLRGISRS